MRSRMPRGVLLAAALFAGPALGQDYPSWPITLVVPFPPGGPVDVAGRLMAQSLGASLRQPVVVENQGGGAGGSIGTARVARATPDGYTLLTGAPYLSGARAFVANLAFDPATDFAPVDLLCLPMTAALPTIRAVQARAVLTTGPTRAAVLPEVPTAAEALPPRGDAGAEVLQWAGLLAPARTPPAIILKLNQALVAALEDPALQARIAALGAEPFPPARRTQEAMAALIAADTATITEAARSMGVRPE